MSSFAAKTRAEAVVLAAQQDIWDALVSPELMARFTPFLERVIADGEHWRWELAGLDVLGVKVAPAFTERMELEPEDRIVFSHDPAHPDEMTAVEGTYVLSDHEDGGTDVSIDLEIACHLPLPGLTRPAVERVMAGVVKHMGTVYSRNLLNHLGEA